MSKKRRNSFEELEDVKTTEEEPTVVKLSYQHWFNNLVSKRKVKFWQEEALLVYMKKQGLSEMEDEDSYNRAFENF